MTSQPRRVRIDWYTSHPAPYRFRIWSHLSQKFEFRLRLFENSRRFSRDTGNVGSEWILDRTQHPYPVDEIPTVRFRNLYLALCGLFSFGRPDVIVLGGWESPAYWQLFILAKLRRIPTIGFYESTILTQAYPTGPVARARAYYFQHVDAIVTPGAAATRALEQLGIPRKKIHQGFNPVDVELFHRAAQQARHDSRRGHRYVFVGQLIPRKDPLALLEAFAQVARPDDELWVIGIGELAETLATRSAELGLSRQVSFKGYVPYCELPDLLTHCDTLVLPSNVEVWGLVVNEALAAGLTAIVNERCGVADDVKSMRGVVVFKEDADLEGALRRVRDMSRIETPEILRYTPERFGDVFALVISNLTAAPG